MRASANVQDVTPMITGYPSQAIIPDGELATLAGEVIAERPDLAWQYAPPEGIEELREAFASVYRDQGLGCAAEEVIVTNGARQALLHITRAIGSPGDVVACESPSFAGIISARSNGSWPGVAMSSSISPAMPSGRGRPGR